MGEPKSRSGLCIQEKYFLHLLRIEVELFGRPACILLTALSDLFELT
jgi:hypothetical protein